MKKFIYSILIISVITVGAVVALEVQADWECYRTGHSIPDANKVEDQACVSAYDACVVVQKQLGQEYTDCANVCHGITRYKTYVNPTTCPEDPADATSGGEGRYEENVKDGTCANQCDPDK